MIPQAILRVFSHLRHFSRKSSSQVVCYDKSMQRSLLLGKHTCASVTVTQYSQSRNIQSHAMFTATLFSVTQYLFYVNKVLQSDLKNQYWYTFIVSAVTSPRTKQVSVQYVSCTVTFLRRHLLVSFWSSILLIGHLLLTFRKLEKLESAHSIIEVTQVCALIVENITHLNFVTIGFPWCH